MDVILGDAFESSEDKKCVREWLDVNVRIIAESHKFNIDSLKKIIVPESLEAEEQTIRNYCGDGSEELYCTLDAKARAVYCILDNELVQYIFIRLRTIAPILRGGPARHKDSDKAKHVLCHELAHIHDRYTRWKLGLIPLKKQENKEGYFAFLGDICWEEFYAYRECIALPVAEPDWYSWGQQLAKFRQKVRKSTLNNHDEEVALRIITNDVVEIIVNTAGLISSAGLAKSGITALTILEDGKSLEIYQMISEKLDSLLLDFPQLKMPNPFQELEYSIEHGLNLLELAIEDVPGNGIRAILFNSI